MSYILRALKQSERDRQQGRSPEERPIYEHKSATSDNRRWILVSVVLALMILVLGGTLLFKDSPQVVEQASIDVPSENKITPSALETTTPTATPTVQYTAPKVDVRPLSHQAIPQLSTPIKQDKTKVIATPAIVENQSTQSAESITEEETEEVYSPPPLRKVKSVDGIEINVHIYSPTPKQRFVFLNGIKYKEGDILSGTGATLEGITSNGVVLDYGDRKIHLEVTN